MSALYNIHRILIGIGIFAISLTSCKKFVTVPLSPTAITNANVYNNDVTAIAAQTGIYDKMMNGNSITGGGVIDVSFYAALSADELTLWPGNTNQVYTEYYLNELTNQNTSYTDFWTDIYPVIYDVNVALQEINVSTNLTPAIKQQLLGEAEFLRALSYFYLVNLYGDVPLILTPNYTDNITVSRTPQNQVWQQIITDLINAQQMLSPNYLDGTLLNSTSSRVRPTKWAAAALLARTYLYNGQWAKAAAEADTVINNTAMFSLSSLNNVFLAAGNNEAILQLQPVATGWNTPDAEIFIIPATGFSGQWPVYLNSGLINSFEPNDQRRRSWVDSVIITGQTYYYAYKYKVNTYNAAVKEYEMVLRLGEQYLIRAEAEAELNDLTDATNDVNKIRSRAGLPGLSNSISSNQANLLAAIQQERRVELFTEWGHRWLDMKRTGTVNTIMGSPGNAYGAKAQGTWNSDWQLYPIPLTQLQLDPDLVQNAGY